jgi:hypothetical protein
LPGRSHSFSAASRHAQPSSREWRSSATKAFQRVCATSSPSMTTQVYWACISAWARLLPWAGSSSVRGRISRWRSSRHDFRQKAQPPA